MSASVAAVLDPEVESQLGPETSGSGEAGEPVKGPQLIDHVKLGFAYQMHLKDEWQKVRLAHVSSGRSFFVFTRGGKHQETISMTSRMLARMCETGRFRAVESAYLHGAGDAAGAQAARRAQGADEALTPPPAASARAMRSAAPRLAGSAMPRPAMSKAVPWSGLVRTNGRPSVTLTPRSTPRYFTGIRPWSWVIATTRSNSPGWSGALRARMKTVSGAYGPLASMPSARAAATAGAMTRRFLVAEQAALAGVRVEAGDGDARPRQAQAQRRRVGDADRLEHRVEGDRVDRLAQRQVDRHQHRAQLVVGQHHAHRRRAAARAASACSISVWPGYGTPAAASASLWIGAVTIPPACALLHQPHRALDAGGRGPAAARVDPAERRLDQVGRQALDLEHRQAVGRHVGELPRVVEPRHRQQPADDAGGAPHHGDIADDERARRLAALEQPGDDLRADAGGIAHGDRQRQRRRWKPCAIVVPASVR